MANFIDCTSNSFDFWTLIGSLFSKVTSTGQVLFRICIKTAGSNCSVINCDTKEDFVQLFNQSLEMGADGYPALRVVLASHLNGTGLEPAMSCGEMDSLDLIARQSFTCDSNGDTALLVGYVCAEFLEQG